PMYFNYNDNTLGDTRKAFVNASVIVCRDKEPLIYDSYKESIKSFAQRKLKEGNMDEYYAYIYQELLFSQESRAEVGGLSEILFTYRLYCDDPRIRSVIVCHSQMEKEEVWPSVQGVAYPRIYTDDAVILFQD